MCWRCWASKGNNLAEVPIPARASRSQRSGVNPTPDSVLRVSSPRAPTPQAPTPPQSTSHIPEPSRVASTPVRVGYSSSETEQPYGLKVLADGIDPILDLVAVHGLNGHRERTWTAENGALWLRDYLPRVVPNIRILTYGYDGRTRGSILSCQTIGDHAVDLVTTLHQNRKYEKASERPIIFIAHSIGGIIVKNALIHSNAANPGNLECHNAIKTSTYGILFFGTPHQGTDSLALKRTLLGIASLFTNTNSAILRDLDEGSSLLQWQLGQYTHISQNFDTKFFYETYAPPGGNSVVVPKSSAVVLGATNAEVIAINTDHEGLVKYGSVDDHNFDVVSKYISSMSQEAPSKVRENWSRWEGTKAQHQSNFPDLLADKRIKILKWISKVEYMKHHQNAKEDLLENTGGWLLDKEEFRKWWSPNASGILWLRGIPGAGKTKLTCMVIDFLKSLCMPDEPVAYFYCSKNEPQRRDPAFLLQAIVKQLSLVVSDPSILAKPTVAEYNKRAENGLAEGSLSLKESQKLIVSLLEIYPQTTIIIDALDEIDPEKRLGLFKALEEILDSGKPVKIFISSRDNIDIKLKLEGVPNLYINAEDNGGDIKRFVYREVESAIKDKQLLRGNIPNGLKDRIIYTIVKDANGMFLWASLQIKQLCRLKFEDDIRDRLGKLPRTLEETYAQIWDEINLGTPKEQKIAKRGLMWAMCALRPLNQQLWAEVSYWPEHTTADDPDTLFDLCRNFVIWDRQLDMVKFAHLSVQEFLESKSFNHVDANIMAAESCLLFLEDPESHLPLMHNPVNWQRPENSTVKMFAQYSSIHWVDHVEKSYNEAIRISQRILDLLEQFLGTSTEPGKAYSRWLQTAEAGAKLWFEPYPFEYLSSKSPNPLFAMSYFHFGEELKAKWERENFDIDMLNGNGQTLLLGVTRRSSRWLMDFLLERGADINFNGGRPLGSALINHQEEALVKLLEKGAAWNDLVISPLELLKEVVGRWSKAVIEVILARNSEIEITEEIVIAAAGSYHGKGALELLLERDTRIMVTEAVLVAAVENIFNKEIIEFLLARDNNIKITEEILTAAAGTKSYYGKETIELLLARDSSIVITETVLMAATTNRYRGKEIIELLLTRKGTVITGAILVAAIGGHCGEDIIEFLLTRASSTEITEAVLMAAAKSYPREKALDLILARGDNIEVTEAILVEAASSHSTKAIEFLISKSKSIKITEAVMIAATGSSSAKEIMEFLISMDGTIEITEAVWTAARTAAKNRYRNNGALEVLLARDCRDSSAIITEEILTAAVTSSNAKELVDILLARDNDFEVTEAVLAAAAGSHNADAIKLLLASDSSIQITEAVLTAAVKNSHGKDVIEYLARDYNVMITESILVAALDSYHNKNVIEFLARESEIVITEPVLVAAVRSHTREALKLLLARGGGVGVTEAVLLAAVESHYGKDAVEFLASDSNIMITEAVLVAAAKSSSAEAIKHLLARDRNIEITEAVLAAVVESCQGTEIIEAVLARGGGTKITEAVLTAATRSRSTEALELLLSRDISLTITEAVLVGAAGNSLGKEFIQLLARDTGIMITEAILMAAAGGFNGKDTIEFLFARDSSIIVTEAILTAAAGGYNGKDTIEFLLARDSNIIITEAVLKAATAAAKGHHSKDVIKYLLSRDSSIRVSEAILTTAVESQFSDKFLIEGDATRRSDILLDRLLLMFHAGFRNNDKEILEIFLAKDDNTKITETIIEAAVGGGILGDKVVIALCRYGDFNICGDCSTSSMEIALAKAAAIKETDRAIVEMLLATNSSIMISEAVITVAARDVVSDAEIMKVLQSKSSKAKITQKIMREAAAKTADTKAIMEMLLARQSRIDTGAATAAVAQYPLSEKGAIELLIPRYGEIATYSVSLEQYLAPSGHPHINIHLLESPVVTDHVSLNKKNFSTATGVESSSRHSSLVSDAIYPFMSL